MRRLLASLALTLLLLGCQKGDEKRREEPAAATATAATGERPAGIAAEDVATIDAMAQLIAGLRAAIEANQTDCDRMAAGAAAVMERGKPVLARARVLEERLAADPAAHAWAKARMEEKAGGVERLLTGVDRCKEHPGVQQALSGFLQ